MAKKYLSAKFLEILVLTVAVTGALLFVTWQLASSPVEPAADELHRDVAFLASELDQLRSRLKSYQARETVLEREAEVLRQANRLLRDEESARQSELNQLRSEVDFYRRLAGTGGAQEGLDIYRAELTPTGSPKVFQFELTLTQNIRRAAIIAGLVRLSIEGTRDDRPVTLSWGEINDTGAPEPAFRFTYFQQLDGYLTLPDGFSPTRLIVTLESPEQARPIQRRFDWSRLLEAPPDPAPGDSDAG